MSQVDRELGGLHDLEALGERLHHPVLDPVVDHLHEVARTRRPDVEEAARLGQVLQERLDVLVGGGVTADHHAVALLQPPDPAGHAGVEEADALLRRLGGAALRVAEVRVAAVDDDVAVLEQAEDRLEGVLGRVAGRDHQPHDAGLRELRGELDQRVGRPLGVRPRIGLDRVAVLAQPLDHVGAHPAEADHSEIHVISSSCTRATGRPRSFNAA